MSSLPKSIIDCEMLKVYFEQIGIDEISRIRVFIDNGRALSSKNTSFHKFFSEVFINEELMKLVEDCIEKIFSNQYKYYLWGVEQDSGSNRIKKAMEECGIFNCFSVHYYNEGYFDMYIFAATKKKTHVDYINNLLIFESYITLLESEIFQSVDDDEVIKFPTKSINEYKTKENTFKQQQIKIIKTMIQESLKKGCYFLKYLESTFRFTLRQVQCLWYAGKGKSYKKIAQMMIKNKNNESIDERSVEGYFQCIRDKFKDKSCHKNTEQIVDLFRNSALSKLISFLEGLLTEDEFKYFLNELFLPSEELEDERK